MRIFLLLQTLLLTALMAMPSAAALADADLDDWRVRAIHARMLAENDIPAAYKEAQRLQSSLPASAGPADKVRALNLLARIEVYLGDTSAAERHAKEAFELAQQNGDRAGQAEADLNNALNYVNMARFDLMSEAVKHSMDILAGVNRPELLVEAMLRTSMMFRRFDRFEDSIQVAMQTVDIAQRSNNPSMLVHAYQGMAVAYGYSGRHAEERDYYQKMRRAAQDAHSRLQEGDALIGLGSTMAEMSDAKSGERLIRDGILLYRKAGGPFYLAHGLHTLAFNLHKQGRFTEAQAAINETVALYEKRSNKVGLWWALNLRSQNSKELGMIAEARADADRAYKLSIAIGHAVYQSESARMQAVGAAELGDFKQAYRLSAEAAELAAKNARERASEHMLELTKRYENDSKQRQLDELTRRNEMHALQQRWLWTVLAGSVALLVVSVLFLLRVRRSREEVRKLNVSLEQRVQERTAELHQSRQSLAEAQRIAHLGSWELDLAANKLKWSDEVFRIFEIEPQAFGATYEAFLAAVHPEDRNRVAEAYSRSLRKHEPYEIEHRLLLPDGRIKYVHERSETVFDADDKPLHSIGTVQDITERKLSEMALRESLEQITTLNRDLEESVRTTEEQATELEASQVELKSALEFSEGVINAIPDILFEMDRNGRYLNVWTRTPELLAVQRAALLGKTANELLSPENAAAAMEGIREADEKGVAVCKDMCFELPDGKHWFAHTLAKKPGTSNSETTFIALSRDITERKHMEEELAARERNFRSLTENLPDNIARWDTEGRYLYINPTHSHTLGVDADEIVGKMLPETHDRVRAALAEVVATGKAIALVRQSVQSDGETYTHEVSLAPEYDAEGRVVSVVGLGRDMTQMLRVQDALAAREHELRSLAESSPGMMGCFYLRPDGTVCMPYVSPKIFDLFGLRPQDVKEDAAALMQLNHPDDAQRVLDTIAESARTMTPWHCEYRIQHPTKGLRWMESNTNPQPHPDGGTIWYGYVHDITERKLSEEKQLELQRQLQMIAENLPGAVTHYRLHSDLSGQLLYASKGLQDLFGLTMQDLTDGIAPMIARIHPEDLPQAVAEQEHASRTLSTVVSEFRVHHPEKGEIWVQQISTPVPESASSKLWYSLMFDITERKRGEQKLKEALEFSEGIINAIPDLLFEVDEEGRYLNVWTHTPELLAAQKEVLLGKTVSDVLLPESAATILEALREAGERGVSVGKVIRIDLPQGESWFEISVSKKPGGSSTTTTFLVLSRDITGRKHMEAALQESEARYRYNSNLLQAIIESPSSSVSIYALDREYRFMAFNSRFREAAKRLWHADIELGMSMLDVIDNDAHREFSRQGFDHVLSGNHGFLESKEERVEDGKVICEYHDNYGSPIYNDNGEVIGMTVFVLNITERKLMEEKLAIREQEFRALAENSPDTIARYIHGGIRTYINPLFAKLAGKPAHEMLGVTAADYRATPEALAYHNALLHSLETGEEGECEYTWPACDGRLITSHIRIVPEFGADGKVTSVLAVGRDITERKRMEEALREREVFLDTLLNAIPVPVFYKDTNGIYLGVNRAYETFFGASPAQLVGKSVFDTHPKALAEIYYAKDKEVFERGVEVQQYESQIQHKNGTLRDVFFSKAAFFDEQGRVKGLVGAILDITERKQMEVALKESEARYRYHFNQLQSMLESASSVSVFALDRNYCYLFFNKRHQEGAKRIRGTDIAIGMNMIESIPDAEFRAFCRRGFDHVLAGNSVFLESKEKVDKDGTLAYEYNDNFGSPIYDDKGDVVGLTVFAINTTERKHLEAELLASRNFLDSVIDSVSDPIFVKDRQHRWTFLNDAFCAFIGRPRDVLVGKSDYDFFPKEQADVFWAKDEFVFKSGEVNLNEESFTSANGEVHHIQTKKTPFISGDGREMLVGVIRDITELKHYEAAREAALAEAQRLASLRSEFIAHMSHELRTPLNGILGYAQMLGRDAKLGQKQQASVDVIRQSGEHLLALVEDILDLARIESGKLELNIGDIPLPPFLQVVTRIVDVRAKQKDIGFVCEFSPDLPSGIRGDEKRLRQVLLNLLSNAVKFTHHGNVTLRVKRVAKARLQFEVADTGIGIAPTEREAIFRPFEQAGAAQQREGGTGLGLAISRQLVRLMGGDIAVESRVGEGSTFRFELELPEVDLGRETLHAPRSETRHTAGGAAESAPSALIAPPQEEIRELHQLALHGNMRDIVRYAERLDGLDPAYHAFAAHVKKLAEGYQSKAILAFVEGYLK